MELRAPGRVAEQLLYTHRGGGKGSGLFENTVRGVQDARAAGVDGIEFDVRRTADGVLVVNHDAHLGPIRNPDWVARNTYADLKAAKPQLATFREILDAAQGMRLDIERKGGGHTAQFLQELHDAGVDPARTVITSFNHRAIREVHELEPTWTTGLLLEPLKAAPWLRTERGAEWTAARAAAMGASFLAPHVSSFDAVAKAAEGHGLLLVPWTVTEKADFERLAAHPQTAGLIVDDSRWAVALRAGLDAPEHGGTALAPAVGAAPSR